jgi:hypothetical protein
MRLGREAAWVRFLRLRCAVGAGQGFAIRVRLTGSHGVRGYRREFFLMATDKFRDGGHDPR